MIPLKFNGLDVFGGVVASNVSATSLCSPDFAQVIAVAGKGSLEAESSVQTSMAAMPMASAGDTPAVRFDRTPSRTRDLTQSASTSLDMNGAGASDIVPTAPEAEGAVAPLTDIKPESAKASDGYIVATAYQKRPFQGDTPEPTEDQPIASNNDVPESVAALPLSAEVEGRHTDQTTLLATKSLSDAPPPQILVGASVVPAIPVTISQVEDQPQLPATDLVSRLPMRARASKADFPRDMWAPKADGPSASPVPLPMPEAPRPLLLQADPVAPPSADYRTPSPIVVPAIERALPTLVERMVAFTPTIIDVARDLAQLGDARDMKFNVRPEILGPVAVTIERTDIGPSLRLGVESPAALQAARQAESGLNDPRHGNPFVNVTVDLTASDQRGRAPRAVPVLRPGHAVIANEEPNAPALTGRFA
jgi:hypothetical protein